MAALVQEDGIVIGRRIDLHHRSEPGAFNTLKETFQKGAACYYAAPNLSYPHTMIMDYCYSANMSFDCHVVLNKSHSRRLFLIEAKIFRRF